MPLASLKFAVFVKFIRLSSWRVVSSLSNWYCSSHWSLGYICVEWSGVMALRAQEVPRNLWLRFIFCYSGSASSAHGNCFVLRISLCTLTVWHISWKKLNCRKGKSHCAALFSGQCRPEQPKLMLCVVLNTLNYCNANKRDCFEMRPELYGKLFEAANENESSSLEIAGKCVLAVGKKIMRLVQKQRTYTRYKKTQGQCWIFRVCLFVSGMEWISFHWTQVLFQHFCQLHQFLFEPPV